MYVLFFLETLSCCLSDWVLGAAIWSFSAFLICHLLYMSIYFVHQFLLCIVGIWGMFLNMPRVYAYNWHIATAYTVELQLLEHRWLVYHGLFELIFESLRIFSDSSRKQILREIFLFYHEIVCCVYSLESPFASWPGAMIKSHWLELPISRTYFHGPKDVRAIEVWL